MTIGPGRFLFAPRACGFLMRGTVALRSCRFLSVGARPMAPAIRAFSILVVTIVAAGAMASVGAELCRVPCQWQRAQVPVLVTDPALVQVAAVPSIHLQ